MTPRRRQYFHLGDVTARGHHPIQVEPFQPAQLEDLVDHLEDVGVERCFHLPHLEIAGQESVGEAL